MLAFWIYAVSVADGARDVAVFVGLFSGAAAIVSSAYYFFESDDKVPLAGKIAKVSLALASMALLVMVLAPDKKTGYLMLGAYAAQQMAASDAAQAIPKKVLELIEQRLDDALKKQ